MIKFTNLSNLTLNLKNRYVGLHTTSRLPTGYKELKYISSTSSGGQYIDLEYKLLEDTRDIGINIKFNVKGNGSDNLGLATLLSSQPEANPYPGFVLRKDGSGCLEFVAKWEFTNSSKVSNKYYSKYLSRPATNTYVYINNIYEFSELLNNIPSTQLNNFSCHLFCALNDSNAPFRFIEADLYYLRITKDNVIIRDLIPALKLSNNEVGLYDVKNDKFYVSLSNTSFIAGPDSIKPRKILKIFNGTNKIWETDLWYGIRWCEETNVVERIGNPELHKTLPLQSQMRRCMVLDDGTVYKYVSSVNPLLYEDGTTAHYDGTDGQVMVEIPAYYHESGHMTINNTLWNYIKLYPDLRLGVTSRKCYIGAFELILDNSNNSTAKGCSVSMLDLAAMLITSNTTSVNASDVLYLSDAATYRNYNYDNIDTTSVKCSYGRPTTNRNRATFRGICARRGVNWSLQTWDAYNSLLRLYFVEYANFNSQATFNSTLTNDGYKQGGLGSGATNTISTKWNEFNGHNPFIPCGVTIPLGNNTGVVSYIFAADEYETGAAYTTYVPSYRGIENPFGHIYKFIDGFNRQGGLDANGNAIEKIYICNDVSKLAENAADGYILVSQTAPRASGNIGGIVLDKEGTFWPKPGGYTRYSDYFYNAYANGTWYTLFVGGDAVFGSGAGLLYFFASHGAGYASAAIGSRLLHTNNS